MAFEVGKKYTYAQNQFSVSREAGKLCFLIPNPASATPFKVKPFDFQASKLPEKLTLIYRGGDRFEQDLSLFIPELYTPGETYKFRVMRQEGTTGPVSLRDDVNGLTFYPVNLGYQKFARFQRLTCRVVSTDGGRLKLAYVREKVAEGPKFTLKSLAELPEGSIIERRVFERILGMSIFGEAVAMRRSNDPAWVIATLEVIRKYIPQWLGTNLHRRVRWLQKLKHLTVSLIENSVYLDEFDPEDRMKKQQQLATFIDDCDDFIHAVEYITSGTDEKFINDTLHSMERTGWLYSPERKMRQMMALFTLRNDYAHNYIKRIFTVIRSRHTDAHFLEVFGRGFIVMLSIFINNESKFVDPYNRDLLRELIEAIAIELLLTKDQEYEQWNLHRGLLYMFASLIVDNSTSNLPTKAFESFAERYEAPLEFTWRDLEDITRLCYANLHDTAPLRPSDDKGVTVYEGENARLTIGSAEASLVPAVTGDSTRQALSRHPVSGRKFQVMLNRPLDEKTRVDSLTLADQRLVWDEIEQRLHDLPTKEEAAKAANLEVAKSIPEVGTTVTLRFVKQDEADYNTYHCEITDENFEGSGTIMTRDIVPYPVQSSIEYFHLDDKPMLLKAVVTATNPDGTFKFDMHRQAMDFLQRQATTDRDTQELLDVVITDERPDKYMGVCYNGYNIQIWKKECPETLHLKERVRVTITKTLRNYALDRLFVTAKFEDFVRDKDVNDNYAMVGDAFQYVLDQLSEGQVYEAPEAPKSALDEHPAEPEVEEEEEQVPENYLDARAVVEMSRLFDFMALVNRGNAWESYNMLAMGRLMALLAGDVYRADYLQVKMNLLEVLQKFANDGSLDDATLERLEHQADSFVRLRDADMTQKLETLRTLNSLDKVTQITLPDPADTTNLAALKRLVVSYNILRGLQLNPQRQQIKARIYKLLNLQMPHIDVNSVNVREDLHNEFKESLVVPAGNNMKADPRRQMRELMEVVCGMLNTEGGTLYIGVGNLGVIRGLASDFKFLNNGFEEYDLRDVQDKFSLSLSNGLYEHFGLTYEGTQVCPGLVTIAFEDIADKWICRVNVKAYPGMVRMTDGSVFVRSETSTRPITTRSEQANFERQRLQARQ